MAASDNIDDMTDPIDRCVCSGSLALTKAKMVTLQLMCHVARYALETLTSGILLGDADAFIDERREFMIANSNLHRGSQYARISTNKELNNFWAKKVANASYEKRGPGPNQPKGAIRLNTGITKAEIRELAEKTGLSEKQVDNYLHAERRKHNRLHRQQPHSNQAKS